MAAAAAQAFRIYADNAIAILPASCSINSGSETLDFVQRQTDPQTPHIMSILSHSYLGVKLFREIALKK
jgi:hypothetical protein